MKNFRLSNRLFSLSFWEGVFSYSDLGQSKKNNLFDEIEKLEILREQADYDTGSISKSSSWCLYCIVKYFEPKNIMEIGTFIGKSSWSMMKAQDDSGLIKSYFVTCDMSNDISIPWAGKSVLKQYKKQKSNFMIKNETISPDLVFIDGRISNEELLEFGNLINENTIIVLDDFEGAEKGVVNLFNLRKLSKLKSHFLIYPCDRKKLEEINEFSYAPMAIMLPAKMIELVPQG